MTTILFSKDRAPQLDAFLRSYARHVTPLHQIDVLYKATTARHAAAYAHVFAVYPFASPHAEQSFRADVLALLPTDGAVVFFVDDQVFVRDWTVREWPGLSLRLGMNLTWNYASGDGRPQPLPPFAIDAVTGCRSWRWADGVVAWGYPLSVDGHVFDLAEFHPWVLSLDFASPNTLESELQRFAPVLQARRGLCYELSKVVNVPWNRVQTDWANRCSDVPAGTTDALLERWEAGERIDLSTIDGVVNQSVHQEFPLAFEARG